MLNGKLIDGRITAMLIVLMVASVHCFAVAYGGTLEETRNDIWLTTSLSETEVPWIDGGDVTVSWNTINRGSRTDLDSTAYTITVGHKFFWLIWFEYSLPRVTWDEHLAPDDDHAGSFSFPTWFLPVGEYRVRGVFEYSDGTEMSQEHFFTVQPTLPWWILMAIFLAVAGLIAYRVLNWLNKKYKLKIPFLKRR